MLNRAAVVGLVLALLAASACTGAASGGDKAGGDVESGGGPVVLRMASTPQILTEDAPPVAEFVRRVAALSHGALRIKLIDQWGSYAPDAEAQVVHAVSAGAVDLGWAGSRVLDTLDVPSFRALSAPMLIDSYPLENAVLESTVPGRMLAGLKSAGVTGLGVLGDSLRHPISVTRALLTPADWRGISFGNFLSGVQQESTRALGARPVPVYGPFRSHALDSGEIQGFEMDIRRYDWQGLAAKARYVAANITLWPQIDVVFVNPDRLASLTMQQRGWLDQAAGDAAGRSVALARENATNVGQVCAVGARIVEASASDLAAMRRSLAGVYQAIEQDPQTKSFVQQIEELKSSTPPGAALPIPPYCSGEH
jgi:TRAP-type transport system periplasmic protein